MADRKNKVKEKPWFWLHFGFAQPLKLDVSLLILSRTEKIENQNNFIKYADDQMN